MRLVLAEQNEAIQATSIFHSGAGVKLQAIDADMAERVLVELLTRNVVAFPIHNSFIVQKSHEVASNGRQGSSCGESVPPRWCSWSICLCWTVR